MPSSRTTSTSRRSASTSTCGASAGICWAARSDPWGRVHERWADTDRLNAANGGNLLSAEEGFQSQWGERPPERFIGHASP